MRPRTLRRRLVLAGLGGMLAAGLLTTGVAKAEPAGDWLAVNADRVCAALDAEPTADGVQTVMWGYVADGYTTEFVGENVAFAIMLWCPEHEPALQAFIDRWADTRTAIA